MAEDRVSVGELHSALWCDVSYKPVGGQTKICLSQLPRNDWTQRVASLYAYKPAADDPQAKLIAWWWALGLPLYDTDGKPVQGCEAVKKKGPLDWHNLVKLQVSLAELREFLVRQECWLPAGLYPEDPLNTEALERAPDEDFSYSLRVAIAESELPRLRRQLEAKKREAIEPGGDKRWADQVGELEEQIARLEQFEKQKLSIEEPAEDDLPSRLRKEEEGVEGSRKQKTARLEQAEILVSEIEKRSKERLSEPIFRADFPGDKPWIIELAGEVAPGCLLSRATEHQREDLRKKTGVYCNQTARTNAKKDEIFGLFPEVKKQKP